MNCNLENPFFGGGPPVAAAASAGDRGRNRRRGAGRGSSGVEIRKRQSANERIRRSRQHLNCQEEGDEDKMEVEQGKTCKTVNVEDNRRPIVPISARLYGRPLQPAAAAAASAAGLRLQRRVWKNSDDSSSSSSSSSSSVKCICLRPLKMICCGICGQWTEGRVRKLCIVHPAHTYLHDVGACINKECQANPMHLDEYEFPEGSELKQPTVDEDFYERGNLTG